MAKVKNARLDIEGIDDGTRRWKLRVTYEVRFHAWESGAWYRETVEICSASPAGRRRAPLRRLQHDPIRLDTATAVPEGHGYHTLARSIPEQIVGPEVLDENVDRRLWQVDPCHGEAQAYLLRNEDRIVAHVRLEPCLPRTVTAVSNVVREQFGPAP